MDRLTKCSEIFIKVGIVDVWKCGRWDHVGKMLMNVNNVENYCEPQTGKLTNKEGEKERESISKSRSLSSKYSKS
jgi:hypothetical protein